MVLALRVQNELSTSLFCFLSNPTPIHQIMTNRFHSLTVVFDANMREDDAQGLMAAISHMRGVISVEGNVADLDEHVAEMRVRNELTDKILDVLRRPSKS